MILPETDGEAQGGRECECRGEVHQGVEVLPRRVAYQAQGSQEAVRHLSPLGVLSIRRLTIEVRVGTIPCWESSSGVVMITRTGLAPTTSLNKSPTTLPCPPGPSHPPLFPLLALMSFSRRYFTSPENNLEICGEIRPKSKFLGNSAATIMEGASHVLLLDRKDEGEYHISMPNM